jgi:hypothetical protein
MKINVLIITILLIFNCFEILLAKEKYPYDEYTDRMEGILGPENVTDEKISLIGAHLINAQQCMDSNKTYTLGLYSFDSLRISVDIREMRSSYFMHPKNAITGREFQYFSWPDKILKYYDLQPSNLIGLAETRETDVTSIFPLLIFCGKPTKLSFDYSFSFFARKRIKSFYFEISKLDDDKNIFIKELKNLSKDFSILWNGNDEDGREAEPGWYLISVDVKFQSLPGSLLKPRVTLNYKFYHNSLIWSSEFSFRND